MFTPRAWRLRRSTTASRTGSAHAISRGFKVAVAFDQIQVAARRIAGAVERTACPHSVPLSRATGCEIFCKLEFLQRTGSFKERGARNALLLLDEERRRRGVITASAGNHALGLSYHAGLLGIPVT